MHHCRRVDSLPNSLVALEAEIEAAVSDGIVVVFSAGNGHVAFPGMLPDVVSAGGGYVNEIGGMEASDYASAFPSKIYAGRHVPDFCGAVGLLQNRARYVMLPLQPSCKIDQDGSPADETGDNDGGECSAALLQRHPTCSCLCATLAKRSFPDPSDVKQLLRSSARDVANGHANLASTETAGGLPAGSGSDGATGAGLVDAMAALRLV